MFGKLAHLMYRRRRYVLSTWLIILLAAGALAGRVGSVLDAGDFTATGSDSAKAAQVLDLQFHQNDQKVMLVVFHRAQATVNDASFRAGVQRAATRLRTDSALQVSYLDNPLVSGNRQLIATDRHGVTLLFSSTLTTTKLQDQTAQVRQLVRTPGFDTYVTGIPAQNYDTQKANQDDLAKGDAITVPILILILLLVFGTVVATALPLVLAASSIVLSLALVFIVGHFMSTVVYVTNMVTVLGLGIGIDYSLFILYRFREELQARGNDVEGAIVRTMETTGRAVFYSGLTVAIDISSLLLTGVPFMESMGLGGLLVPVTALLVTMTMLPALLSVLGTRVNRFRVVPRRFLHTGDRGLWQRLATAIMRRPLVAGSVALVVLLGLTYPATRLNFAFGSLQNLPKAQESVAGALFMQDHFPGAPNPVQVVLQHQGVGDLRQPAAFAALGVFQQAIARDPQVVRVSGPETGSETSRHLSADGRHALISVVSRAELGTKDAEDLVRRLRTLSAAESGSILSGNSIYVGGAQANYTDFDDSLYAKFPLVVGIVLVLTYGFLFYAFRSLFLPLKAVALNLLSVGASYGMLQLVFQRGIGSHLLGFTQESGVAGWVPIFLFAFLFGLSMDYEVFLLSRIRERWLDTGDNGESVVYGLQKTGRLITSAAAIMVVAFSGFLVGSQVQLKEFGFGLLASIALDATLIRIVLVPAIMQVMGERNWWVPAFLRGFANRDAFSKGDDDLDLAWDAESSAA